MSGARSRTSTSYVPWDFTASVVPKVWRMPDGTRIGFNWTDSAMTVEGVNVPKHAARVLP